MPEDPALGGNALLPCKTECDCKQYEACNGGVCVYDYTATHKGCTKGR